jgi:hypothetical protein
MVKVKKAFPGAFSFGRTLKLALLLSALALSLVTYNMQDRVAAATTPFTDSTFNNSDWIVTVLAEPVPPVGATFTQLTDTTGGQGTYQQVHQVLGGTGVFPKPPVATQTRSAVRSIHIKPAANYDPQSQGEITSLDYSALVRTDATEPNTQHVGVQR